MGLFIGGAILLAGAATAIASSSSAKKNRESAEEMSEAALAQQREMEAKLEKQRAIYRAMEFTNPYANVENYFADMENAFEDITINQQQAQFQRQVGAQQRANILQGLRGATGASGIAGLAQTLANQGALQAQQISASIGAQEARNQMAMAQAAQQMDIMERQGASASEMARLGGEQMLQQMEMDRQATLLGVAQGQSAGANAALQQAYSNQMAATSAASAATAQAWSQVGQAAIMGAYMYKAGGPTATTTTTTTNPISPTGTGTFSGGETISPYMT